MSEETNRHFNIANFNSTKTEEVVVDTPIEENVAVEENVVVEEVAPTEVVVDTPEVVAEEEQLEPIKVKKKVSVPTLDFIEQNKDLLKSYLTDGSTDYKSLSDLDAVRLKLTKDNPSWSKEDVEEELNEKFSLHLKSQDEDYLTDEDKAQLKRGERKLKSEALKAKEYLESIKPSLSELPNYEYEYEEDETPLQPTKTIEEYELETQKQVEDYKANVWIPNLKNTLDTQVSNITEEVEYELGGNKGVIKVDYKLSEVEKQEVLKQLTDYVGNPSDNKYVGEDGVVDYKGFIEDKTKEKFYTKLIKSAVKEAMSIASENVFKKHVVNFSEEVRNVEEPEHKVGVMDFLKAKNNR